MSLTVGRVHALFPSIDLVILRYAKSPGVIGVYRGKISSAYPDISLGDWIEFYTGALFAKEIRRCQAPLCPVFKVDFRLSKLVTIERSK